MNAYYVLLWVVGFLGSFVAGFFFLKLAGSDERSAGAASAYRAIAVLLTAMIIYGASFDGLNIGAVAAFLTILSMAVFKKTPH